MEEAENIKAFDSTEAILYSDVCGIIDYARK